MHVVVVGCGRVGSSLAANLIEGGHSVSVIDRRPEAFGRLGRNFAGRTLVGIGFDRDRLTEAGIEEAGALAAVETCPIPSTPRAARAAAAGAQCSCHTDPT